MAVSRRNALKALYGFFSVDFDQPIPFDALEQLASWGSRYAQICRILEPFTVVLYAELRGRHRAGVIQWTAELRTAVELFRSLLSMSVLRRAQFSRTLDSFRENAPLSSNCYLVEYDASLTGFGILLYKWVPGLQQWAPFGGSPPINIESWGWAGKPEFQNTAEFVACVVGVTLLRQYKVDISTVSLRGDSVTAGRWGLTRRARSLIALNTAVVYTLVLLMGRMDIGQYSLLTTKENWRCDLLSRQGTWQTLGAQDHSWNSIRPRAVKGLAELLRLCHPGATWVESAEGWGRARRTLRQLFD